MSSDFGITMVSPVCVCAETHNLAKYWNFLMLHIEDTEKKVVCVKASSSVTD